MQDLIADPEFATTRILMPCSATKRETPATGLPAWRRYSGPMWLSLAARLDAPEAAGGRVYGRGVIVLSALFGWMRATENVPMYDRRMTEASASWMINRGIWRGCDVRANEGTIATRSQFNAFGGFVDALGDNLGRSRAPVDQIIIAGAGHYREVMLAAIEQARDAALVTRYVRVVMVAGGIGEQRRDLGAMVDAVLGRPAAEQRVVDRLLRDVRDPQEV